MDVTTVSLGNTEISLYSLLMLLGFAAAYLLSVFFAPKHGAKRSELALYGPLAGILGLLLGRIIYCYLQSSEMFYDELGQFRGLAIFFDLSEGSACVIGVFAGALMAAPIAASIMKGRKSHILDAAALPGLLLFAFARIIEPLSGHGGGIDVETEALRFFPLMLENGALAVCYIEALLALIIFVCCALCYRKFHHSGTLFLLSLALLSAAQLLPESFRYDGELRIFNFGRVNQIGFAIFLALALLWALMRCGDKRRILRHALIDYGLLFIGAGIFICGEFSLEAKLGFHWPHLVIYLIMLAAVLGMTAVVALRILKEDRRHRSHHHHHE